MSDLFSNAGQKIRSYAIGVFCVSLVLLTIGALGTLIACAQAGFLGFVMGVFAAVVEFIIGALAAYIFSLFLVAFGDLVQDTADNKKLSAQLVEYQSRSFAAASGVPVDWYCAQCGSKNNPGAATCTNCGSSRHFGTGVTQKPRPAAATINPDDYAVGTPPPPSTSLPDKWVCRNCNTQNSNNYSMCKKCGQYRS